MGAHIDRVIVALYSVRRLRHGTLLPLSSVVPWSLVLIVSIVSPVDNLFVVVLGAVPAYLVLGVVQGELDKIADPGLLSVAQSDRRLESAAPCGHLRHVSSASPCIVGLPLIVALIAYEKASSGSSPSTTATSPLPRRRRGCRRTAGRVGCDAEDERPFSGDADVLMVHIGLIGHHLPASLSLGLSILFWVIVVVWLFNNGDNTEDLFGSGLSVISIPGLCLGTLGASLIANLDIVGLFAVFQFPQSHKATCSTAVLGTVVVHVRVVGIEPGRTEVTKVCLAPKTDHLCNSKSVSRLSRY